MLGPHIPGGKDSRNFGNHFLVCQNKAPLVCGQQIVEPRGVRDNTDGDKTPGYRKDILLTGLDILQYHGLQGLTPLKLFHHRVPVNLDLVTVQDLLLQASSPPTAAPSVNQRGFFSKAVEKEDFGERGVAAPDHGDLLVPVEGAVAGGAETHP